MSFIAVTAFIRGELFAYTLGDGDVATLFPVPIVHKCDFQQQSVTNIDFIFDLSFEDSMIQNSMCAARDLLRLNLGKRPNGEEIAHIASPGRGVSGQNNYLGLMYIGLEQENGVTGEAAHALEANLVFMLYSSFSDYGDSLKVLSQALHIYQSHISLEPAAFPALKLPRALLIEPWFLPLAQQLQIWNPFGEDSVPFMFYRLRSLSFKTPVAQAPRVREVESAVEKVGR